MTQTVKHWPALAGSDFHMKLMRLCSRSLPRRPTQDLPGSDPPGEHAHLPGVGHLDAVQRASPGGSHITQVTWLQMKIQSALVKNSILSCKEKTYRYMLVFNKTVRSQRPCHTSCQNGFRGSNRKQLSHHEHVRGSRHRTQLTQK